MTVKEGGGEIGKNQELKGEGGTGSKGWQSRNARSVRTVATGIFYLSR